MGNFYIDFEAMQYKNHIISIGCVNEQGETFYSLIRPSYKKYQNRKITNFITELTGITTEMTEAAPSLEEVISAFSKWVNDKTPVFYTYGHADKTFVETTKHHAETLKTKNFLNLIEKNLIDYTPKVSEHFYLQSPPKLIYVYNYLFNEEKKQNHNALDDAYMLYKINSKINNSPKEEVELFSKYKEAKKTMIVKSIENDIIIEYESLNAAARAIIGNNGIAAHSNRVRHVVASIKKASKENTKYKNKIWIIQGEE